MFMHELVAAPDQSERRLVARKIVKLLVKSVKEYNYALAGICCSVLTCTEGVPPPLEYSVEDGADGKIIRKLLPVIGHLFFHCRDKPDILSLFEKKAGPSLYRNHTYRHPWLKFRLFALCFGCSIPLFASSSSSPL